MSTRSLSFRLAAWYSFMLLLASVAFAAMTWATVKSVVQASVDDLLERRLQGLVDTVTREADGPDDVDDNLADLLKATPEGDLAQVHDDANRIIFPVEPSKSAWATAWSAANPNVRKGTLVVEGRAYRTLDQQASLLGRPFRFLLASSLESQRAIERRLLSAFALSAPAALLLCGVGGWAIARRALSPLEAVADAAAGITSTRLSKRIAVPATGDVLERLSRTFNEMLERLETSFARVDQFSADASHELRTPLSVIQTTAELALKHGATPDEYRRDLIDIHSEAKRLSSLVDVLLTLARQDSGAQSIEMAELDLVAVACAAGDAYRGPIETKGLSFVFNAPAHPCIRVGNEASLRQLFGCLLDNALEHTTEGGITMSIAAGSEIEVAVVDTGEGIEEAELPKIFDRFYRADSSRSRSAGHLGLGLSIAQRIAALHGASLGVTSCLGKGSRFAVRFP